MAGCRGRCDSVGCFAGAHAHSQPRRLPNFVIIFTDDQGYGDLGSYGTESDRFKGYMDPRIEYYNVPLMRDDKIIERPAEQTTITQRYTDEGIALSTRTASGRSFSISRTTPTCRCSVRRSSRTAARAADMET